MGRTLTKAHVVVHLPLDTLEFDAISVTHNDDYGFCDIIHDDSDGQRHYVRFPLTAVTWIDVTPAATE